MCARGLAWVHSLELGSEDLDLQPLCARGLAVLRGNTPGAVQVMRSLPESFC